MWHDKLDAEIKEWHQSIMESTNRCEWTDAALKSTQMREELPQHVPEWYVAQMRDTLELSDAGLRMLQSGMISTASIREILVASRLLDLEHKE